MLLFDDAGRRRENSEGIFALLGLWCLTQLE